MGMIKKVFWTVVVLGGIVFAFNKYGYIDKKGLPNIDNKALSKDWQKACKHADKTITDWADQFVDKD